MQSNHLLSADGFEAEGLCQFHGNIVYIFFAPALNRSTTVRTGRQVHGVSALLARVLLRGLLPGHVVEGGARPRGVRRHETIPSGYPIDLAVGM